MLPWYRTSRLLVASILIASPVMAAEYPLGTWYTEGHENETYVQMIMRSAPDGTFIKDFRDITNCKAIKGWRETGTWKRVGSKYVTTTEYVEGQNIRLHYDDPFEITRIDDNHANMFDIQTKVTWAMEGVPSGYGFPASLRCGPGT